MLKHSILTSFIALAWRTYGVFGALRDPSCDMGVLFLVILVVLVQIKFFSTQPFEDYFKIVAADRLQ